MNKLEEWDESTSIDWWKESRIQLNKVIRKYNSWIDKHTKSLTKTSKLLSKINKHLQKPYSNTDGGSGYKEELITMKDNVKRTLKKLINDV